MKERREYLRKKKTASNFKRFNSVCVGSTSSLLTQTEAFPQSGIKHPKNTPKSLAEVHSASERLQLVLTALGWGMQGTLGANGTGPETPCKHCFFLPFLLYYSINQLFLNNHPPKIC